MDIDKPQISISESVRNHMDNKYQMLNLKHFLQKTNNMSIDESTDNLDDQMDSCRLILDQNDTTTPSNTYKSLKSPRGVK